MSNVKVTEPKNLDKTKKLPVMIHYPEMDGKKVLDTRNNLKHLLNLFNIKVSWNIMTRTREVIIPDVISFIDEEENAALYEIYQLATTNGMPNGKLDRHLDSLAWMNTYHPIVKCIEEKIWDKEPRLNRFIETIETKDNSLAHKIIKRWMISAIAAAFSEKGFSAQGALVLQGKQGIGKTTLVKSLDPINCGAVKEGLLLDPNSKDSIMTATSCWIGEIAELDGTFHISDLPSLKAYITSAVDILRFPYKEKNSRLARRSVYVATVNENNFLIDDTGNRRWWTVEVEKINFNHNLDMQQIWAEVYFLYSQGEQAWLTFDESNLVNEANIEHEQIDPIEEKVMQYFDWRENWKQFNTQQLTSTEVLERIGHNALKKSDTTRMGKILIKLTNCKPIRRFHTLPTNKIHKF